VQLGIFIPRNCGSRDIHPQELWNEVYHAQKLCNQVYSVIHPQELRNPGRLYSSSGTAEPGIFILRNCGPVLFILRQCGTNYIHPKELWTMYSTFILRNCGTRYNHPQELLTYSSSGAAEPGIFILTQTIWNQLWTMYIHLRNCGTMYIYTSSETVEPGIYSSSGTQEPGIFIRRNYELVSQVYCIHPQNCGLGIFIIQP